MNDKHVAVYLRVSTEGSKDGKIQSTGMQKLEIESYLKSKAISDYQVYEDVGISGTKKDRPALKKMMQDCRNGKVSMVVCYKLDRMARSLGHLLNLLEEFHSLEVKFVAVKDNIDMDSAMGRLMTQILGAFAEFEAAVIKERINSGLANARSKGVKLGRPMKNGHNVVKKLKDDGKSVKEISLHTGLSRQSIYRTLGKEQNG